MSNISLNMIPKASMRMFPEEISIQIGTLVNIDLVMSTLGRTICWEDKQSKKRS